MTLRRLKDLEGNGSQYDIDYVARLDSSPLEGMHICYLGSSVTYGETSLQTAFPEYIAKRNHTTFVKEAVSGTTLVTTGAGGRSYVERMKKLDRHEKFDLFVCQLSTNDATQNKPLGNVSDTDTATVCGAIHAIVDYVKTTWGCPIVFYTNAAYESEHYAAMVAALKQIATETGIGVIDLYTDRTFNDITQPQRHLYMTDPIHPTKAGYLEWWTPHMEQYLYQLFTGETAQVIR